jgi:hypothetical protein
VKVRFVNDEDRCSYVQHWMNSPLIDVPVSNDEHWHNRSNFVVEDNQALIREMERNPLERMEKIRCTDSMMNNTMMMDGLEEDVIEVYDDCTDRSKKEYLIHWWQDARYS